MTLHDKYLTKRLFLEKKLINHNGALHLNYCRKNDDFSVSEQRNPDTVFTNVGPNPWGLTEKGQRGVPTLSDENIRFFISVEKLSPALENLLKN